MLRPRPGETLNIHRVEPDGSRFTFLASVAPPGRIINPLDRETIRSERMTFFRPQGLTAEDLFQAIREIYGPEQQGENSKRHSWSFPFERVRSRVPDYLCRGTR